MTMKEKFVRFFRFLQNSIYLTERDTKFEQQKE